MFTDSSKNYHDFLLKSDDYIQLKDLNIKIHTRYFKTKEEEIKREWFLNNLFFQYDSKDYNLSEVILFFNHIDEDNPEFFLQPEQIIKIVKGRLIIRDNYNILFIDYFQQLSEEERKKINLS
ncbi:hypothetical protein [Candidatus Phytoplasma sacchari]|uniref:Uncharacterized protein n=1 Tax=Candidatus Phytoplasma sacchari TaxID=2609813 RepID=A0ABY7M1V3_9MOLU|nr:hypothetical protein O7R10_01990 [Candidatus Phytoplasma sacchari]